MVDQNRNYTLVEDETRKDRRGGPLTKRRGRDDGALQTHTQSTQLVQVIKFLPKVPFFIPNLPTIYMFEMQAMSIHTTAPEEAGRKTPSLENKSRSRVAPGIH